MTLKSGDRSDIVAYRLEKAWNTLKEVKDIGAIGYWRLAANRLYYAAYQSGDYEDLFDWNEDDVVPLIPRVEEYISRINQLITTNVDI